MDPIAAAAGIAGLIGTVIAILVGLSNLISFSQGQAEKRRAKRQKQQEKVDPSSPADAPTAPSSQAPAAQQADAPAQPLLAPDPATPITRPTNLPAEPTPLIGRDQEVTAIRSLLQRSEVRMVTLVGPPGAGKTRLAIKVAATVRDEFADGVFFVALSTLREAALVAPTIAQAIVLLDARGQAQAETLARQLQDKQVLLVLDNFEQVMPSATLVSGLLAAAPRLEVLVTSREVLHVSGEHEFAVTPLALPDLAHPSPELLAQSPAVALFEQRAQAIQPHFRLASDNALAVAQLCTLLDGLPLAIELAAARIKLFTPQEMLARLEDRFQWLTSGARDLPAHQHTLQSTLDWSYNLLDAQEQLLLRRLGVFVGGCSFAAVEHVCVGQGDRALPLWEILASLIDKSLLQRTQGSAGEPRFVMLSTIREYAHAQLLASDEAAAIRDNHLAYYLQLAVGVTSQPNAMLPAQLAQLEQEHDNLRAALRWTLAQEDVHSMARLVEAMLPFWDQHGHSREGLQWLAAVVARRQQLPPRAQAALGPRQRC